MKKTLKQEVDLVTGVVVEEAYYLDGLLHRSSSEGPAHVRRNAESGKPSMELYYEHGKLHRKDGPADIEYFVDGRKASETWYYQNAIHRDPNQGPAYIERWRCKDGKIVDGLTQFMVFGNIYRDPKKGPCQIQREQDGSVFSEVYSESPEAAARRAAKPKSAKASALSLP